MPLSTEQSQDLLPRRIAHRLELCGRGEILHLGELVVGW